MFRTAQINPYNTNLHLLTLTYDMLCTIVVMHGREIEFPWEKGPYNDPKLQFMGYPNFERRWTPNY